MLNNPIAQRALTDKPKRQAMIKRMSPFEKSSKKVAKESFLAKAGFCALTTRRTFVAPILELPNSLILTFANCLASKKAKRDRADQISDYIKKQIDVYIQSEYLSLIKNKG